MDGWGREPERRSETGALLPGCITRVCILHEGQALHRLSLTFNTTAFLGLNVTLIKREPQDKQSCLEHGRGKCLCKAQGLTLESSFSSNCQDGN